MAMKHATTRYHYDRVKAQLVRVEYLLQSNCLLQSNRLSSPTACLP